jgi:hydroxyacylglutathione hydrolase
MLLRRFFHPRLAQSSYLIGCGRSREAIIIDPHRDVELFLAAARSEGMRITAVTETHVHADFLSGSCDLAAQTGARLYLSGEGRGPWSYTDDLVRATGAVLLRDGYVIRIGDVRVEARHTPGHTPEHLSFVITDTAAAGEPMGAITGDFLFVGDVGRPDLLERAVHVAGSAEGAARQLFHSLGRLSTYTDYLQVWPGHSAGSACGKGLSAVPQSTLGYERRHNWALRVDDEDEFVGEVLQGQPEPPAYFADMKRLNAQGAPAWNEVMRPALVTPDELVAAVARGTVVIDTRPCDEYAAGHIPGTLNIPLDRSFLNWAGSLVPLTADVLLIGDEMQLGHAVADLGLIGIDRVAGHAGAEVIEAWPRSGRSLEEVTQVGPVQAAGRLRGDDITLLDVRGSMERVEGYIPGSVHIPLTELRERLDELERGRHVIVHCQGGARSAIAASVLLSRGFTDVENLQGGLNAWRDARQTVLTQPTSGSEAPPI